MRIRLYLRCAGRLGLLPLICLALRNADAGSATWNLNPTSGDWNTAGNWSPDTVPNGPSDIATFEVSNVTDVSLMTSTQLNSIIFDSGASAFAISVIGQGRAKSRLKISGLGVINNSGITQQLITGPAAEGGVGRIILTGNAMMGQSMIVTNRSAGSNPHLAITTFADTASAGDATFINEGGATHVPSYGGSTQFMGNATAAEGTFLCGSSGKLAYGGDVRFLDHSTAANGTFVLEGAVVANGAGGSVLFYQTSSAGNGVFTINGSDVEESGGGDLFFNDSSSAGNATLIANGGAVDGGGITFYGTSTGGTARVQLYARNGKVRGAGTLHVSATDLTIGSLEGDGLVDIEFSSHGLSVGSNSLNTTFTGTIEGIGALFKVGAGTLTLTGANTYSSGTVVNQGTLIAANTTGSATGPDIVSVYAGTLGGSGTVTDTVVVGTGSGTGAFLAPAANTKIPTTFTTTGLLFLKADATYIYTLRAKPSRSQADRVIANEVTISGAKFAFQPKISGTLQAGTVFTAISNTSSNPIIGTFSDLPDGAIVTVNGNNFQANYEGGDGNDLTLTVVP